MAARPRQARGSNICGPPEKREEVNTTMRYRVSAAASILRTHEPDPRLRARPFSFGRRLAPALALVAAVLVFAACSNGPTTPAAATLLANAHTTFDADTSLHFVMSVAHPGPGTVSNPSITKAEGDVQRPSDLKASATADAGIASVSVTLIIVGDKEWITDPISGKFVATDEYGSFLNIFDAQRGIGSLLTKLQNPSAPADSSANGASCWKISGTVSPSDLGNLFGELATKQPIPVSVCIGKSDNQLDAATLSGIIVGGDTAQTSRTFYLSSFNKSVTVATPAPGQ
jgi:LppX_LprAFG lipoprotein